MEKEPKIAEYIRKTIPRHNMFYAPMIQFSKHDEFVSSKIRYVGEKTLEKHLLERIYQDPFSCLSQVLDTHLYLTLGVEKLVYANLVHLNIHGNNILFDETSQIPMITEFRLSRMHTEEPVEDIEDTEDTEDIETDTCLEIHFLKDLIKTPNWEKTTIKTSVWEKRVDSYFDKMEVIPDSLKEEAKKKWKNYIKNKMAHKKGKQVWIEFSQFWNTWDNYSVLKIYASFLHRFLIEEQFPSCAFIESYHKILLSAMLSTPDKRDTPTQTISKLDVLVHSLDKEEYQKWIVSIFKESVGK